MVTPPRRARLVLCALLLAGCGQSTEPRRTAVPARLETVAGAVFGAAVEGEADRELGVRVVDQFGRAVPGVLVDFGVTSGAAATLTPASVRTNEEGRAATRLRAGTLAGAIDVRATVEGVPVPARFSGIVRPGPAARIAIAPRLLRLNAVGATALVRIDAHDVFGNVVPASAVAFTSEDPTLFTVDEAGQVRALRAGASARLIVSAGARADSSLVSVADPALQPCLAAATIVAPHPRDAIEVDASRGLCLRAGDEGAQLLLVPFSAAASTLTQTPLDLLSLGITAPAPEPASTLAAFTSHEMDPAATLDARLRATEGELLGRAARERDAGLAAVTGAAGAVALGQLVTLNANAVQDCREPDLRTGRVVAVSDRAVIVADTANPAGGFSSDDYQHYATTFDTLVHAVNAPAFGEPQDLDGNGRVVIFYTRAVNELSPASANFYVGGFFWARDFLARGSCAGSNVGEMFYMLVPDPEGVVRTASGARSRSFTRGFVDSVTVATLAHEYQHLINASRRLYVTRTAIPEDAWLNEALSHVAEELLFYRTSGAVPRANIDAARLASPTFEDAFLRYALPNLGRFRSFLLNPESFSPFADDQGTGTSVGSRGASWAFLRYLADHHASTDGEIWYRLVNSATSGFANLRQVFGVEPLVAMQDFAASLYLDDRLPGLPARFTLPSWNFRSLYTVIPGPRTFPLSVRSPSAGFTNALLLRSGASAYYRFAIPAGGEGYLQVNSSGLPVPATIRFLIVRLE